MVQIYMISRKMLGALLLIPFYSLDMLNFQLILLSSPFQTTGSNPGFPCFREFTIPQESKPFDLLFLNLSNTIHVSLFSTTTFRELRYPEIILVSRIAWSKLVIGQKDWSKSQRRHSVYHSSIVFLHQTSFPEMQRMEGNRNLGTKDFLLLSVELQ